MFLLRLHKRHNFLFDSINLPVTLGNTKASSYPQDSLKSPNKVFAFI